MCYILSGSSWAVFLVVLSTVQLITTREQQLRACSVRLHKDTEFRGNYHTLWTKPNGDCIPFPKKYNDAVKSIDTYDLCVVLWSESGCKGTAVRLSRYSYGTRDLDNVGFGRIASSLQVCKGVDVHDTEAVPPPNLGAEYHVLNHP